MPRAPPHLRDKGFPGALSLASARCPALRQLKLDHLDLDQPPTPLAQLTRLSIITCDAPADGDGPPPLTSLAAAAPKLKALTVGGWHDAPAAAAAKGHPGVEELELCYSDDEGADESYAAWLPAAADMPALTSLDFSMGSRLGGSSLFAGADMEGEAGDAAQLLRVCG